MILVNKTSNTIRFEVDILSQDTKIFDLQVGEKLTSVMGGLDGVRIIISDNMSEGDLINPVENDWGNAVVKGENDDQTKGSTPKNNKKHPVVRRNRDKSRRK